MSRHKSSYQTWSEHADAGPNISSVGRAEVSVEGWLAPLVAAGRGEHRVRVKNNKYPGIRVRDDDDRV